MTAAPWWWAPCRGGTVVRGAVVPPRGAVVGGAGPAAGGTVVGGAVVGGTGLAGG